MIKKCDNCKHKNKTMIEILTCTNENSEYSGEFVANDNLCKEWEGQDA